MIERELDVPVFYSISPRARSNGGNINSGVTWVVVVVVVARMVVVTVAVVVEVEWQRI